MSTKYPLHVLCGFMNKPDKNTNRHMSSLSLSFQPLLNQLMGDDGAINQACG